MSKTNNLVTNNLKHHISPDRLVVLKEFLIKLCNNTALPSSPHPSLGNRKLALPGSLPEILSLCSISSLCTGSLFQRSFLKDSLEPEESNCVFLESRSPLVGWQSPPISFKIYLSTDLKGRVAEGEEDKEKDYGRKLCRKRGLSCSGSLPA